MIRISEGNFLHPGAIGFDGSVIFTFEADKEQECFLLLYDKVTRIRIKRIKVPREYTIGSLRSVRVDGIDFSKCVYLYEIDDRIVLDTYATSIIGRRIWKDERRLEDCRQVFAGISQRESLWKDDVFPDIPRDEMVMYKLHVRGFSMDGSKVHNKGTFAGLVEKIPYFKELGITTLVVMPIYEFEEWMFSEEKTQHLSWDASENDVIVPLSEDEPPKVNFWGYTKGNYFAPKASYAASDDAAQELKHLIHTLHENKIELVMEIFFAGQLLHSTMINVLRHWVIEYHVDGFALMGDSIPIASITSDMILRRSKFFCPGYVQGVLEQSRYNNLFIMNDEFMYPARKLLNRMEGRTYELCAQMRRQGRGYGFVNYIATNNGFTLADLFSYGEKHNEANGENNTDGAVWNYSFGCGEEGPTRKKAIMELRTRQIKNALCAVMLSQAVPLVMAGDEFGNSQGGNNNAYCQDNKTGWVNWPRSASSLKLLSFYKKLSAFRRQHPVLRSLEPYQMCDYKRLGFPDLSYHCDQPWVNEIPASRYAVGLLYNGAYAKTEDGTLDDTLYICYNYHMGMQLMSLPAPIKGGKWEMIMSTAEGDGDFLDEPYILEDQKLLMVHGQSVAILRLIPPARSSDGIR